MKTISMSSVTNALSDSEMKDVKGGGGPQSCSEEISVHRI